MSGAVPCGFRLEPTTIQDIRTKMMIPDPDTANIAQLMFEMYAQPSTSSRDIACYFAQEGILVYDKELRRGFISQMLRNPIYAQADLELYEFFKGQGAVVVNEAADFAGTNGCYLYQGRDVQERKNKDLKNQILVLAPSEGIVPAAPCCAQGRSSRATSAPASRGLPPAGPSLRVRDERTAPLHSLFPA